MTSDEAKELFSAAYDDLLDEDDRALFFAALADDEALSDEYDEFTALLRNASGLTDETEDLEIDLLSGVQSKLRDRSGGRFYRDRFSRTTGPGSTLPLALAVLMILMLAVAWAGLHFVQVESDTEAAGAARE